MRVRLRWWAAAARRPAAVQPRRAGAAGYSITLPYAVGRRRRRRRRAPVSQVPPPATIVPPATLQGVHRLTCLEEGMSAEVEICGRISGMVPAEGMESIPDDVWRTIFVNL